MQFIKDNWKKIVIAGVVALGMFVLGAMTGGGIRGCIDKALVKEAVGNK
jgi:hypothetical protein